MPTKSAFASKGVWGGAIATFAGIVSFFHTVNYVGLAQSVIDNWPAIAAALGGVVAAWGRIRASTFIAPKETTGALSIIAAATLASGALALQSCSVLSSIQAKMSPEQKAAFAQLASSAVTIGTNVINSATSLGIATVANKIPQSDNPYLASVATGLRTLQGTPLVTTAQVQDVISTFGDPNAKDKFSALGTKVANIASDYATKPITDATLEAAATALDQLNRAAADMQAKAGG